MKVRQALCGKERQALYGKERRALYGKMRRALYGKMRQALYINLRRASRGKVIPIGLLIAIASSWGAQAWGDTKQVDRGSPEAGASTFRAYCANCHGENGRGDGPVAGYLKIPPTDLTGLSASEDGVFPVERVYGSIDGREKVRLHGARDMPIWGNAFVRSGKEPEARVRRRIDDLIAYLRSLQKE